MLRSLLVGLSCLCWMAHGAAAQISDNVVRIGVLNDQSSVFADSSGPGSVVAAQMAAEDFGGTVAGAHIEIIAADHQNKPDVGAAIARQWFDTGGVDAIADLGNSAVALAVIDLAKARDKAVLVSAGASAALTGKACSPVTVHWTFDTWSLPNSLARSVIKEGGESWFFITADYAFGHDIESVTRGLVTSSGGRVLGSAQHPLNTADFGSFLVQAQASGARVIALANAGTDAANAIKQSREFRLLAGGQRVVALNAMLTDVHAIGLDAAQGIYAAETFYWDSNSATRDWSRRWSQRNGGRYPTMIQAGVYAVVTHYLRAVAATHTDVGRAVVEAMKRMPAQDPLFGTTEIRPDGRALHDMYVFRVKSPTESTSPWDLYTLVDTIPAQQAFRPMSQGGCPMVATP